RSVFSVKLAYLVLDKRARPQTTLKGDNMEYLGRIWVSWATMKVAVFSWQLLRDRIPTRRRVLVGTSETSCVFFGVVEESFDDLLFPIRGYLRFGIIFLRIEFVSPNSVVQVIESFFGMGSAVGGARSSTTEILVDRVKLSS
ncbi:hypothetical protein L195_g035552, partial [Trifolium pratense]